MTTDFRVLCAELVDQLTQSAEVHWNYVCNKIARQCDAVVASARAALADEPAPEGREPVSFTGRFTFPADGEVAELVTWLQEIGETIKPNHLAEHQRYKRAAELLERLSPPQPVPVSERLPGPEDCTAEGRCWLCYTDVCNVTQWTLGVRSAILDWPISHWLPAHALPVPGQEVER